MTIQDDHSDDELWNYITKDIEPLEDQKQTQTHQVPAQKQPKRAKTRAPSHLHDTDNAPHQTLTKHHAGTGLDKRSAERLRRGEMRIDARLDLHGLSRSAAHEALNHFILSAYHNESRCVLVITGKGGRKSVLDDRSGTHDRPQPQQGVLKSSVPEWLNTAPLRDLVLKTQSAQPKDGGTGALYVLIKRNR